MKSRKQKSNSKGMTLIELIVAAALFGIAVVAATVSIVNSITTQRAIAATVDTNALYGQLLVVLHDTNICSTNLNPTLPANSTNPATLTFDSTAATPAINVNTIWTGTSYPGNVIAQTGLQLPSGLTITSVQLVGLKRIPPSTTTWTGTWDVAYSNAGRSGLIVLPDTKIQSVFTVDISNPTQAFITNCLGPTPGIQSCPTPPTSSVNWTLIGKAGTTGSFCVMSNPQGPATLLDAKLYCAGLLVPGFGPAHLCQQKEWYSACMIATQGFGASIPTPSPAVNFPFSGTATWETYDSYDPAGANYSGNMSGSNGCNHAGAGTSDLTSDNVSGTLSFRCCL